MLRPLHQNIIIETIEGESGKEGKGRIPTGKVVACSPDIKNLAVDSIVMYSRNSGEYVNYKSRVYLIIDYRDLLAVIEEGKENS